MNGATARWQARWATASPAEVRAAIRRGEITGPTAGLAVGAAQANLVVVPAAWAEAFAEFCAKNALACPLLDRTAPGDPAPRGVAPGADLRTDLPRYRVFRRGEPQADEPTDVRALWHDDAVGFLLGCSFTFERALVEAGLAVRHLERGTNVPMYRTSRDCAPAGPFAGQLVVSMRPFRPTELEKVREITGQFPTMHGAPVHAGDPAALGIADLGRPDFGDPVPVAPDEVPVFWACGVTPQLALEQARLPWAITHSPGAMFITDRSDESYRQV